MCGTGFSFHTNKWNKKITFTARSRSTLLRENLCSLVHRRFWRTLEAGSGTAACFVPVPSKHIEIYKQNVPPLYLQYCKQRLLFWKTPRGSAFNRTWTETKLNQDRTRTGIWTGLGSQTLYAETVQTNRSHRYRGLIFWWNFWILTETKRDVATGAADFRIKALSAGLRGVSFSERQIWRFLLFPRLSFLWLWFQRSFYCEKVNLTVHILWFWNWNNLTIWNCDDWSHKISIHRIFERKIL